MVIGEAISVEKKLYDAASKGDLITFQQLLSQQTNPHLLIEEASFAFSRNVLHVATLCGQVGIVEEVLKINPRLARIPDSQKLSPLHIAAAEGHVEIAKRLVSVAPEMCWRRDDQGMNPVHVAAMNGHVEVLRELLLLNPLPATERVHRGQTVLHLCVKHRQQRALEVLAEKVGELVCAKDDDGETLLHLAVRSNQIQMIQFLVESDNIEKQTQNSMGKTALQILMESPPSVRNDYSETKRMLLSLSDQSFLERLPKMNDITMLVVVLIATMAFQAAVSPPGGMWQDETSSHRAGESVMASTHPKIYKHFVRANTTAFVSSLITIFLITTELPAKSILVATITLLAMWVSMASIGVSYGASIMVTTPNTGMQSSLSHIIVIVIVVSVSMFLACSLLDELDLLYSSWKIKKRQRVDFRDYSIPIRALYSIFQLREDAMCGSLFYKLQHNLFRFRQRIIKS